MRAVAVPSKKNLMRIGIYAEQALLLRRVLRCNDIDVLEEMMEKKREVFKTSGPWFRRCYNTPYLEETQMKMANDVIEGFGVEYCGEVDMRDGPPLEYVNLGDTYKLTLCRFRDRFIVSSYGDIVERHPKLFEGR